MKSDEAPQTSYRVEGEWLVEDVNEHTCGTARDGYYGAHEPGCGTVPIVRLADLFADAARTADADARLAAAEDQEDYRFQAAHAAQWQALAEKHAARLAAVGALLPDECWVTRSADAVCTDLLGGTFPGGAPFTEAMCCLPCRVRAALSATAPDAGQREGQEREWGPPHGDCALRREPHEPHVLLGPGGNKPGSRCRGRADRPEQP